MFDGKPFLSKSIADGLVTPNEVKNAVELPTYRSVINNKNYSQKIRKIIDSTPLEAEKTPDTKPKGAPKSSASPSSARQFKELYREPATYFSEVFRGYDNKRNIP